MATEAQTDAEFEAQKAAAEAVDPYTDKNNPPSWWPADFEGKWDEASGRWVEPEPKNDPGQTSPEPEVPAPDVGTGELPPADPEVEQKEPDVG